MSNQLELSVKERTISGKQVKQLRREGLVPANMYGHNLTSVPLQVEGTALRKLLDHGGSKVILSLKVDEKTAVPVMIKKIQYGALSRAPLHVDFYVVAATEVLRTPIQLSFVNEAPAASLSGVSILRSLSEVMVECLPGNLPESIEVDLSSLKEIGDVIRVANLTAQPGVTILTDPNVMVAAANQNARAETVEEVEE